MNPVPRGHHEQALEWVTGIIRKHIPALLRLLIAAMLLTGIATGFWFRLWKSGVQYGWTHDSRWGDHVTGSEAVVFVLGISIGAIWFWIKFARLGIASLKRPRETGGSPSAPDE